MRDDAYQHIRAIRQRVDGTKLPLNLHPAFHTFVSSVKNGDVSIAEIFHYLARVRKHSILDGSVVLLKGFPKIFRELLP